MTTIHNPDEDQLLAAQHALEEKGAIAECDDHGYYIDNLDSGAVEEAREELLQSGMTEEAANQALEEVLGNAGLECPGCARNRDS